MLYSIRVPQFFSRMSAVLLTVALLLSSLPIMAMTAEATASSASINFKSIPKASYAQGEELILIATRGMTLPQNGKIDVVVTSANGGEFSGANLSGSGSCTSAFVTGPGDADITGTNSQKGFCYRNSNIGTDTITATFTHGEGEVVEVATLTVEIVASTSGGDGNQGGGAVWTNIGPCESPQNVNHYVVGQDFYGHGENFTPNTTYTWVVKDPGKNGDPLETGTITTDANGNFCEMLFTIQDKHVGGPYQFNVGDAKNDNFSIEAGTVVVPVADLSIVKTVSTTTPFEGNTVTYTLTVTNTGPNAATGVVVTDPLASGLTYQSASIDPTTNPPLTWNVGTLAKDATWSVTVTALVGNDQGGLSITNTASATSTVADSNATNNSSSVTIRPVEVTVVVPGCTDTKATNPNPAANQDDGSCTYNLTITKVVSGDTEPNYTAFGFTIDGGATTTFEADGTNVVVVSSSTHTVREVPVTGYTTTYDNCIGVAVTSGNAVCTITNTPVNETKYGTLAVRKVVEGESEYSFTSFSFTVDGGTTTPFEQDGTNEFSLPVGQHTVVENTASGYTTTYNNCENAVVSEGTTTTCTITNTKNSNPTPTCTVDVVSDTSNFVVEKGTFAQALSVVHGAWTATIAGATWIWGDNPVVNPVTDETQTFRKQFGFVGTVTDAKLYVASDNSHSVVLNASTTGADASEDNFKIATQDVYDVTSLIAQGNNELAIAVRNWAGSANPAENPAGLLYKLVISGRPTTDADCSVPYVPPTPEVDTYRIQGYVWHDDNENTDWDGRYSEEQSELIEDSLAGWAVNITNGSSTFSTTTDPDGYYYFDVPAGTWTITEVVQNGWKRTTQESHVVTVPEVETYTLLDSVRNFILPIAHAALLTPYYGDYNFGNDTEDTITPTTSGGGGRSSGSRPRPQVLGATLPTPQVLGEQVSVVPVGAPDTGRGGAAPRGVTFSFTQVLFSRREE